MFFLSSSLLASDFLSLSTRRVAAAASLPRRPPTLHVVSRPFLLAMQPTATRGPAARFPTLSPEHSSKERSFQRIFRVMFFSLMYATALQRVSGEWRRKIRRKRAGGGGIKPFYESLYASRITSILTYRRIKSLRKKLWFSILRKKLCQFFSSAKL